MMTVKDGVKEFLETLQGETLNTDNNKTILNILNCYCLANSIYPTESKEEAKTIREALEDINNANKNDLSSGKLQDILKDWLNKNSYNFYTETSVKQLDGLDAKTLMAIVTHNEQTIHFLDYVPDQPLSKSFEDILDRLRHLHYSEFNADGTKNKPNTLTSRSAETSVTKLPDGTFYASGDPAKWISGFTNTIDGNQNLAIFDVRYLNTNEDGSIHGWSTSQEIIGEPYTGNFFNCDIFLEVIANDNITLPKGNYSVCNINAKLQIRVKTPSEHVITFYGINNPRQFYKFKKASLDVFLANMKIKSNNRDFTVDVYMDGPIDTPVSFSKGDVLGYVIY